MVEIQRIFAIIIIEEKQKKGLATAIAKPR